MKETKVLWEGCISLKHGSGQRIVAKYDEWDNPIFILEIRTLTNTDSLGEEVVYWTQIDISKVSLETNPNIETLKNLKYICELMIAEYPNKKATTQTAPE